MAFILTFAQQLPGYAQKDSLTTILNSEIHDTTRAKVLDAIAQSYLNSNPDTAIIYYQRAITVSQTYLGKIDEKSHERTIKNIASHAFSIGIAHASLGNYNKAIDQFGISLEMGEKMGDLSGVSKSLNGLGIIYGRKGIYHKAIENYLASLRIFEELALDDPEDKAAKAGIAKSFNNLGVAYMNQQDLDKSLEYFLKSLEKFRELGNKNGISTILNNIGIIYNTQKKYEQAIEFHLQSLAMNKEMNNQQGIAQTLMNLGNVYDDLGESQKAIEYYFKSLKINEKIRLRRGIAKNLNNLSISYYNQGDLEEALAYALRGLETSIEISLSIEVKKAYDLLNKIYAGQHDFEQAHQYLKLYSQVKDSLFNEEKSKEIGKLEATYEFEKAEAERVRLEIEELKLENEQTSRRNNLQYSGILIFLVLLGAGLIVLGKLRISIRLAEGLIFFTFLLFFEFTLVLLDPYIEQYSSGAPAIKLAFNALLAAMIFPLHSFFEEGLKKRMMKKSATKEISASQ